MSDRKQTESEVKPQKEPKRRKGPFATVRYGSTSIPIYACKGRRKTRYTLAFYLAGRRVRRSFSCPEEAKKEANLVAQQIQNGQGQLNGLSPHDREAYLAAKRLLEHLGVPLVAAIEEYVHCRRELGDVPLLSANSSPTRLATPRTWVSFSPRWRPRSGRLGWTMPGRWSGSCYPT